MRERDLPFVMEIERLSFPNPWKESSFRGEIANLHISYPNVIIYRPQDKIIGYIIFWLVADEAQISNLAVNPDFKRLGIGDTILKQVLTTMRRMQAKQVILEVRPSNLSARTLYEKNGFTLLGIRRGYYQDPPEDALVMSKSLNYS
jgi:ribosomal-protein-alanine N-acetyltransferase